MYNGGGVSRYVLQAVPAMLAIQLLYALLAGRAVADSEESWFQDIPTITSATRMSQRQVEAPHTITIIDRDMIEASGAVEIAELFRLVPGFQIGQGDTATYSVTYHGQTDSFSRRTQVMVDGRPVYGPVFNSVDWHALGIDMDDIHHIEVVRGPSAATFGENAFAAAINIITLQPFETQGWHLKATAGSLNRNKGFLRYGGHNDDVDFRVGIGFDQATAFKDRNTEKIVRTADLRLLTNPGRGNQFEVHAGVSDGPMGRGAGSLEGSSPADPYQSRDIKRNYQLVRWVRELNNGGDLQLQFYHSYFAEDDHYVIGPLSALLPPVVLLELPVDSRDDVIDFGIFNYKSQRLDMGVQYRSPQLGNWRYVTGLGARQDDFSSDYLIGPKGSEVDERLFRAYISAEFRPAPYIILNGGLMVEKGDLTSTEYSPRLGINYLLSDDRAIRASVSRSMRAPSLLEEHFDFGIRTNDGTMLDALHVTLPGGVDAENITSFEIGYMDTWRDAGITLDLKLYREIIRDEIYERDDVNYPEIVTLVFPDFDGAWVAFNGSRIDTDGAELQLHYQPDRNFLASLQYAYADVDQMLAPDSIKLPRYGFDGTPKHTASLLLSKRFTGNWQISTLISHMSQMSWYGDGGDVDEHMRVDLRLAKGLGGNARQGLIEFIIHNIGEDHEVFDRDHVFDTRYYLRGTLELD